MSKFAVYHEEVTAVVKVTNDGLEKLKDEVGALAAKAQALRPDDDEGLQDLKAQIVELKTSAEQVTPVQLPAAPQCDETPA
jgi:hypothetical protein